MLYISTNTSSSLTLIVVPHWLRLNVLVMLATWKDENLVHHMYVTLSLEEGCLFNGFVSDVFDLYVSLC